MQQLPYLTRHSQQKLKQMLCYDDNFEKNDIMWAQHKANGYNVSKDIKYVERAMSEKQDAMREGGLNLEWLKCVSPHELALTSSGLF